MSNPLHLLFKATDHDRIQFHERKTFQNSRDPRSSHHEARTPLSSSPPRSSSPLRTPYAARHDHSYASIRMSPEITADLGYHHVGEHAYESSSWDHHPSYTTGSIRIKYPAYRQVPEDPVYSSSRDYPPSSDFDSSEYADDMEHDGAYMDSRGRSPGAFIDVEEEEVESQREVYCFGSSSSRTTIFRLSAERGLWKSNPMPLKPTNSFHLLQNRKSAPTPSRLSTPTLTPLRTISEPAPSISAQESQFPSLDKRDLSDRMTEPPTASSEANPLSLATDEVDTMPSLSSDRDSSMDVDDHESPLSPLPPSSPPLSPMSISAPLLSVSRFSSPFSSAPGSPMRNSSPLSELTDEDDDDVADGTDGWHPPPLDVNVSLAFSAPPPNCEPLLLVAEAAVLLLEPKSQPSHATDPVNDEVASSNTSQEPKSKDEPSSSSQNPITSSTILLPNGELLSTNDGVAPAEAQLVRSSEDINPEAHTLTKECPSTLRETNNVPRPREGSIAQQKRKKGPTLERHPKKKRKTSETQNQGKSLTSASKSPRDDKKQDSDKKPAKAIGKKRLDRKEDEENHAFSESEAAQQSIPKSKSSRTNKRTAVEASQRISLSTKRTCKATRTVGRATSTLSNEEEEEEEEDEIIMNSPLDPETAALHSQICGLLIETMAMSRASSLPVSSLYKMVMQDQPSLKTQKSEKEWVKVFDRVLHDGEASKGSGVFGKVDSSGMDHSNRPLEAQWFYVPELDEDQERAALIRAMMPRPAKRSETKKYKQYYWRPLGKVSRWDGEDEL